MKRLWEVEHPFHCEESNYYKNGTIVRYGSWPEFAEEFGAVPNDYVLLFRWDWKTNSWLETPEELIAYHVKYDDYYRAYTLQLCWINQDKGAYWSSLVSVCRADEPAVRSWLAERAAYLRKVWEPLFDAEFEAQ